ncbi:hypothetical protein PVAND_006792 [Polypedilum vanderplanki]|uniref:Uncharacterized protein n=1 Tax=Polypedilum vanderplanki TaxID=319348 RepID=A0A9J6C4Q3_POLVA|nr:hypothetical protein PVAND_006792 [Polypedilum vanderplanki]
MVGKEKPIYKVKNNTLVVNTTNLKHEQMLLSPASSHSSENSDSATGSHCFSSCERKAISKCGDNLETTSRIGPNQRSGLNNFEAAGGNDENYSVPYVSSNHHIPLLQNQQPTCSVNMNVQYHENWKMEDIECKQESDTITLDPYIDNSNNFAPTDNYNDTIHYGGASSSQISSYYSNDMRSNQRNHPLYRNSNSATYSPYQISSSAKSQLPAWYNPPQIPAHHHAFAPPPPPHPSYYQQQQPSASFYPYQTNYMASTATSSDHNMRNMIQMTNSYDYDNSKAINKILNGREARNRAEKHRRDKLNGSIQELSSMVPHVAESPRRVDKTAVLRFSAHGLRIDYVFGKQKSNRYLINPKSTEGLMKLLDTFLLSVTCRGNIVLVSSSVEQYLGHCRSDLYGQSLLNITHPEDHAFLKQQLIPTDLHNLFVAKTDENGEIRSRTKEEEDEIDLKLREDRRDFTIRLARAGPRSEPTQYELVRIDGCFKRADSAPRGRPNTGPTGLQLIRRARGRDDNIPLHSISGNDIILIAMARLIKPPMFCDRLIEACRYEYKTRHLIDGRIVQCDQRISIVAGYMTEEVSGLSPFTFMHRDDVRWVMVALRQMYDFGSPVGESCYRLMSRTGQFIYLKTRGILEIDEKTRQVHSFICINSLVSDDEGKRLIRDMKKKFSAIISEAELSALESDVPAVENPQLLERAILNLITNLNNQTYDDDDDMKSVASDSTICDKQSLAIIAPNTITVKPTIAKAVDVISQVHGKGVQIKDEPKSPEPAENQQVNFQTQMTNDNNFNSTIKLEPGSSNNILSPTSSYSVSSHDSDICSPIASNQNEMISPASRCHTSTNDYYSTHENLPSNPYEFESVRNSSSDSFNSNFSNFGNTAATTTNELNGVNTSSSSGNNNNNNNNSVNANRNSVLKRSHNDDDYTAIIKKRALSNDFNRLSSNQNPPIDLESDISDVLSSTFPDDSLTDQFAYGDLTVATDELTAEQEEQREILKSLRESCSVIQQTPKSHSNGGSSNSSS